MVSNYAETFPSSQRRGGVTAAAKREPARAKPQERLTRRARSASPIGRSLNSGQFGRNISPIFYLGFPLSGSRFALPRLRHRFARRSHPSSAWRGINFALVFLLCVATSTAAPSRIPAVLLPGTSPLVTFRILFVTGSAFDPPGKEGLAALTASMLAQGGTRSMSYDQIVQALYPMASSINAQVDKEMTVFTGTTHIENLDRYYALFKDMLLDPGFRPEDFKRLRDVAINFLKVSLREANDEELGKEELYNIIYTGYPYGNHNTVKISALEKLTLDDVQGFYRNHYNGSKD